MTVIAYRAGVLAADTLISYNSYTNGSRNKIVRCGDYHVALAGEAWLKIVIEQWVEGGADSRKVPKILLKNESKFTSFLMDDFGTLFTFDNGQLLPVDAEYAAIGSGGHMALGAMAHGATAIEAVRAACLHDKSSGGDITHIAARIEFASSAVPGAVTRVLN